MKTLSATDFKKQYGAGATTAFTTDKQDQETGLFESIKNDLKARGEENANLLTSSDGSASGNIAGGFKMAANTAGGVGDVIGEGLKHTPIVGGAFKAAGEAIGAGFKGITDKLSDTKFFKEAAAGSSPDSTLEKGLSVASSGGEIAGNILAADAGGKALTSTTKTAAKIPGALDKAVGSIPKPNLGAAQKYVTSAVKDVSGTLQNRIDHQLAKALDLTPSDLSNIEASTGNQVGKWLSDNNLIGTNKTLTQEAIEGFKNANYSAVRSEIGKVTDVFKPNQIPRYTDALKAIQSQTKDTVGLEKDNATIDNLLRKTTIKLEDVQKVKELLDEHFSLYKVTGDVAGGVAKEGLANLRSELKTFIEAQVKKSTGADIRQLNNNVQTARSLVDAIKTRSPRGLTRATITNRDVMTGLGLTYFGSPILGVAYIILKKIAESPTVRLRVARYLDQLSDAQKAKVSAELNAGKVPADIKKIVGSD